MSPSIRQDVATAAAAPDAAAARAACGHIQHIITKHQLTSRTTCPDLLQVILLQVKLLIKYS